MRFSWDKRKNSQNQQKHGISFEVAIEIFQGKTLERVDNRVDYGEKRIICLGEVAGVVVVCLVYTDRENTRRIISARKASKKERVLYNEKVK